MSETKSTDPRPNKEQQADEPQGEQAAPPSSAAPPPHDDGRLRTWIIGATVALTGLIVLIVVVRTSAPRGTAPILASPTVVPAGAAVLAVQQERQSLAKAKLQLFVHEADQAREALQKIGQESNLWMEKVEAALTGDAGRAVTADPSAVERFHHAYNVPRPNAADLEVRSRSVDALAEGARQAMESGTFYVPGEDALAEIHGHRAWAETKLIELRRNRELAEAMLREAAAAKRTGSSTLAEALAQRERQRVSHIAEKTAAEEEKAREEVAEVQSKARADRIRAVGTQEAVGIRADAKNKVADMKTDVVIDDTGSERERLLRTAKDPAVQAQFRPFLAKGYAEIGTAFTQPLDFPKPASFRMLQHGHALTDHENFALAGSGGLNMFGHNDRPRWPKPTNDAELEEMHRRFELFKDLAPIWIELGLLRP